MSQHESGRGPEYPDLLGAPSHAKELLQESDINSVQPIIYHRLTYG
jgi:hypothetical protein